MPKSGGVIWNSVDRFSYVKDIKIPAYVVKQSANNPEEGCILGWNDEFEQLTNFGYKDIRTKACKYVLQAQQEQDKTKCYESVCSGPCPFRRGSHDALTLENVWINTNRKNSEGKLVKRLVNMHIFPYKYRNSICALHLIVDRKNESPQEEFPR